MPRPLLLLPRPEPAEVLALLPDGPPRQFRWRGVLHQVAYAQGPERIAPEWWRQSPGTAAPDTATTSDTGAADAAALDAAAAAERDYYLVEDSAGRRFWLYRAGLYERGMAAPRWFIHGVLG